MIAPGSFRYAEAESVATLTLDRPQALNALTFEVYRELIDTFRALAGRDSVRVVVLTGQGRAFCTGGDVREIIGPLLERDASQQLEFTRMTCELVAVMRRLPQPIVASLNGVVAGAGAMLALASDIRIAAETARIGFVFVKVGLAGADMGACSLLPRIVGLGRASELLMTGEFIEAREAERIGLYNRVVPGPGLEAATAELAGRLARGPFEGLAATKAALEREANLTLEEALAEEARLQAERMAGPDFREGFAAFLEKRPPRFRGAPR